MSKNGSLGGSVFGVGILAYVSFDTLGSFKKLGFLPCSAVFGIILSGLDILRSPLLLPVTSSGSAALTYSIAILGNSPIVEFLSDDRNDCARSSEGREARNGVFEGGWFYSLFELCVIEVSEGKSLLCSVPLICSRSCWIDRYYGL